jgi:hypothetical protein
VYIVVGAVVLLLGAVLGVVFTVLSVTQWSGHGGFLVGAYIWLAVLLTFGWRMYRMGLYISATRVRLVYPWKTRTLAWPSVTLIDSHPGKVWGMDTVRDAIWLTTTSGEQIETPVQCREKKWWTRGPRSQIGPILHPVEYDQVITTLRASHLDASTRGDLSRG